LKLYNESPLLFVGGCVGVSAVVSFVFAVDTGFGVRVTAGFSVGVGLGLNEFAVGTVALVELGDVVGTSLTNTYPVSEGVGDEAIIDHA
jgi:hypothetical protein